MTRALFSAGPRRLSEADPEWTRNERQAAQSHGFGRFPRLFFTERGLEALRAMMTDRRFADPGKFAHVHQELGIDPMPGGGST